MHTPTLLLLGLTLLAPHAPAAELLLNFDPAQTKVAWTLNASLHTVHGTFRLQSGWIRVDPQSGKAAGELVVDARSGESGSDARDSRMHKSILESPAFPRIVFVPEQVTGAIPAPGTTETIQVQGTFNLHGTPHAMTLPVEVKADAGQYTVHSRFSIPYVSWGLKNPSSFILRVNTSVSIDLQANGRPAATNPATPR